MIRTLTILSLGAMTAACATAEQTAAIECGAAGVGVAFLICKAAGGSTATCAAAGGLTGLAGGALCYSLSDKMAKRRAALAGHENDLDARLAYVKGVNEDTVKYNEDLKKQVAELTDHTNAVAQQVKLNTADEKQLANQRKALDAALKNTDDAIASQKATLSDMRAYQAQHAASSQELSQQIVREQANLQDTQRQAAALANLKQSV
jgi:hypothetical protein